MAIQKRVGTRLARTAFCVLSAGITLYVLFIVTAQIAPLFDSRPNLGLTIDRNLHAFGPTDLEQTAVFRLKNESSVAIEITSVVASCNCISATVGTKVLAPRHTTELSVRMTQPSIGTSSSSVFVQSNAKPNGAITVRLISKARTNEPRIVSLAPGAIRLIQDKCPERELHVVTFEDADADRNLLQVTCSLVNATLEEIDRKSLPLPDGRFARVERTYRIRLEHGEPDMSAFGWIAISFENSAENGQNTRSIPVEVFH